MWRFKFALDHSIPNLPFDLFLVDDEFALDVEIVSLEHFVFGRQFAVLLQLAFQFQFQFCPWNHT